MDGRGSGAALTVFYDGACPLCRREIEHYRRQRGADQIDWVDVSDATQDPVAPGLDRETALGRFHVQLPDGRLAGGAAGFAALWSALPGWRVLGRIAAAPGIRVLAEFAYRAFLKIRPTVQRMARRLDSESKPRWPRWLERELRSDHAGEAGAVEIYRGILAVTRDDHVRAFAARHIETECIHLTMMESLVPAAARSRLLPVWRAAGFTTGALSAMVGPRAVYATIDAVESFVDEHYRAQIDALEADGSYPTLRETLRWFRDDEIEHRDDARSRFAGRDGFLIRLWQIAVGMGSSIGVAAARRF